jgi:hypothetical protein
MARAGSCIDEQVVPAVRRVKLADNQAVVHLYGNRLQAQFFTPLVPTAKTDQKKNGV